MVPPSIDRPYPGKRRRIAAQPGFRRPSCCSWPLRLHHEEMEDYEDPRTPQVDDLRVPLHLGVLARESKPIRYPVFRSPSCASKKDFHHQDTKSTKNQENGSRCARQLSFPKSFPHSPPHLSCLRSSWCPWCLGGFHFPSCRPQPSCPSCLRGESLPGPSRILPAENGHLWPQT